MVDSARALLVELSEERLMSADVVAHAGGQMGSAEQGGVNCGAGDEPADRPQLLRI